MHPMTAKIRLFLDHPLRKAQSLPLDRDQANYLFAVMRLSVGDQIAVINGRDGEWLATITSGSKRGGELRCDEQTRALQSPPDLWLVFAPIKKARTDFIVEKATELGAAAIFPVQTDFTNSERIRQDRLQAHAIEATEQCGGTFVPQVHDLQALSKLLDAWPSDRHILFCDEAKVGDAPTQIGTLPKGKWAIFIGPEGGFSDAERARLTSHPLSHAISLGPRILRADTAAVSALTLWQSALGDWA
jgi:16S rRNA (uracil1498-N3)-methyltransferase